MLNTNKPTFTFGNDYYFIAIGCPIDLRQPINILCLRYMNLAFGVLLI